MFSLGRIGETQAIMQVKRAEIFSGLWFKNDYDYNADRMFHEQRTTKIVQIFLVSNN
jgi:hypothetical protein